MTEGAVHSRICLECRFTYPDTLHFCPFCGEPLMDIRSTSSGPGAAEEKEPPITAGLTIGEYHVQGTLASGGMGVVYAAIHPLIRKRVAIKVLSRRFVADKKAVARFVLEARSVNEIGHHNIVDIFAIGELDDGRNYLVMELIDGIPLHQLLPALGRFEPGQILPLFEQLCDALDTTHRKGFVHRDIKPENILVLRRPPYPFVKILDFGLAKLRTGKLEGVEDTKVGTVVGTPAYMAPEQCRGEAVDGRADVYALGVLLYELLTGEKPFAAATRHETMLAQLLEKPRPPSALQPQLGEALDQVVLKALAKEPAGRQPSAAALFEELRGVLGPAAPWPAMPASLAPVALTPTLPPRREVEALSPEPLTGASHRPAAEALAPEPRASSVGPARTATEPLVPIASADITLPLGLDDTSPSTEKPEGLHPEPIPGASGETWRVRTGEITASPRPAAEISEVTLPRVQVEGIAVDRSGNVDSEPVTQPLPQLGGPTSDTLRRLRAITELGGARTVPLAIPIEGFSDGPTSVERRPPTFSGERGQPWSLGMSMQAPAGAAGPETTGRISFDPLVGAAGESLYTDTSGGQTFVPSDRRRPRHRRTPWLALLAGILAGFGLATVIWFFLR